MFGGEMRRGRRWTRRSGAEMRQTDRQTWRSPAGPCARIKRTATKPSFGPYFTARCAFVRASILISPDNAICTTKTFLKQQKYVHPYKLYLLIFYYRREIKGLLLCYMTLIIINRVLPSLLLFQRTSVVLAYNGKVTLKSHLMRSDKITLHFLCRLFPH